MAAAGGLHAAALARHRQRPMIERTSFTRARVLASRGPRGGRDPLDEIAAPPPGQL